MHIVATQQEQGLPNPINQKPFVADHLKEDDVHPRSTGTMLISHALGKKWVRHLRSDPCL